MTLTATTTATQTATVTEARVRLVMQKVSANFAAFVVRGLVSAESAATWSEDLTYLQLHEAIDFFEVQMKNPDGTWFGLRYQIRADGFIQQDSPAGGIDVYGIPKGTPTKLFARIKDGKHAQVRPHLETRGWRFDGKKLEGTETAMGAFSSGPYGLLRSLRGDWPV